MPLEKLYPSAAQLTLAVVNDDSILSGAQGRSAPTLGEARALTLQGSGHRADLLQVAVKRVYKTVPYQPVVDELTAPLAGDQAGILEDREVLGDRGLRNIEALCDLPGGEVGAGQVSQNLAPYRGRQSLKNLVQSHQILAMYLAD
jgi:hypothetical protein